MKRTAIAALLLFVPLAAMASSFDDLNAVIQLRNQEDWKNALPLFDRALAAGDLSAKLKFDAAIMDLDAVIAARPLLASTVAARARINLERGDATKSRDDLHQVPSMMPEGTQGRQIGVLYWQLGLMAEADKNFTWLVDRGHDL